MYNSTADNGTVKLFQRFWRWLFGKPRRHPPRVRSLSRFALPEVRTEAQRCLTLIGASPSPEQLEMIWSPSAVTRVIAGAGSGKSTTLVLRLLVMNKILGVPFSQIHVFSFTRASTADFREKLVTQLLRLQEHIEGHAPTDDRREEAQAIARSTVSTFHSALARLWYAAPTTAPRPRFFDLLGHDDEKHDEPENTNPFLSGQLEYEQLKVVHAAHERAYKQLAPYRGFIDAARAAAERTYWLKESDEKRLKSESEPWAWRNLLEDEPHYHLLGETGTGEEYLRAVRTVLVRLKQPYGSGARFEIACPIPGLPPGTLTASFSCGGIFIHVEQPLDWKSQKRLAFHQRDRRRMIALYSREPERHRLLRVKDFARRGEHLQLTAEAEARLRSWLNVKAADNVYQAPPLLVSLPGGLREQHIAEVLYQECTFFESLGLSVDLLPAPPRQLDGVSMAVARALPSFLGALRDEVHSRGFVRFADILAALREKRVLSQHKDRLTHLSHLLIDEYQDISPEILEWLRRTLEVLGSENEVSATCIGDDYQSIYGWRGSHPDFLLHPERGGIQLERDDRVVTLRENYRSVQEIIDAAEVTLEKVTQKSRKHGLSRAGARCPGADFSLRLVELQDPFEQETRGHGGSLARAWNELVDLIAGTLRVAGTDAGWKQMTGGRSTLEVLVLCRTNQGLEAAPGSAASLRDSLKRAGLSYVPRIEFRKHTFHRSKGLEADFVLLLEDSAPPEPHPLRDWAYSLRGFADSYSQQQREEARRLAYVAITRARSGLVWAADARPGGCFRDVADHVLRREQELLTPP